MTVILPRLTKDHLLGRSEEAKENKRVAGILQQELCGYWCASAITGPQ